MKSVLNLKYIVGDQIAWLRNARSWHNRYATGPKLALRGGKPPYAPQISDVKIGTLANGNYLTRPDICMEASMITPSFLTEVDARIKTPPSLEYISGKLLKVRGLAITMNSVFSLFNCKIF